MIHFLNGTERDLAVVQWVNRHYGTEAWPVYVEYGDANVPANDLVREQQHLRDGRKLRVDTASPARRGEKGRVLVTVETTATIQATLTLRFCNINPPSAEELRNMVRDTLDNALMNDDVDFVGDADINLVDYRLGVEIVNDPAAKKAVKDAGAAVEETLLP